MIWFQIQSVSVRGALLIAAACLIADSVASKICAASGHMFDNYAIILKEDGFYIFRRGLWETVASA